MKTDVHMENTDLDGLVYTHWSGYIKCQCFQSKAESTDVYTFLGIFAE
jgi:hypothetical protein